MTTHGMVIKIRKKLEIIDIFFVVYVDGLCIEFV